MSRVALFALITIISFPLMANNTLSLLVKGMHCNSCESKFKKTATDIKGIIEVQSVSAADNNAVVVYDEKITNAEQIVKSLAAQTGYTVSVANNATISATGNPSKCCKKDQNKQDCTKKSKQKCTK